MTKPRLIVAIFASALALTGVVSPASAQEINPRAEWQAHPNLVRAVRSCEEALADLQRAPDDFGGNKAQAVADLRARRSIRCARRSSIARTWTTARSTAPASDASAGRRLRAAAGAAAWRSAPDRL